MGRAGTHDPGLPPVVDAVRRLGTEPPTILLARRRHSTITLHPLGACRTCGAR